mmetsp:Transcript_7032/g.13361  ORF Transcript_7032/g.13361 Transcript_7032/m.13361 type:complete len:201 (+) Transcript_7032:627-1229(+)
MHREVLHKRNVCWNLGDFPAGKPDDQNPGTPLECLEALVILLPADVVKKYVHSIRRCLLDAIPQLHARLEGGVDYGVRSYLPQDLALCLPARHRHHPAAHAFGDLDSGYPYPPTGTQYQHDLAPLELCPLLQRHVRRPERNGQPRRLLHLRQAQVLRRAQRQHLARRRHALLGKGPRGRSADSCARLQVKHFCANLRHHA